MLANDIFIEYYYSEIESMEDEEVENNEEWEGDDFEDVEELKEDHDIEENEDLPEYGSQFSVLMKHNSKYYLFEMYRNKFELGIPVILLQSILFVVKLIEEANSDHLIEYLTSLSTAPLIPHEIPDLSFRKAARKLIKLKIQIAHDLIQEGKAGLN